MTKCLKTILSVLSVCVLGNAYAGNSREFSLGAAAVFNEYGAANGDGKRIATDYAGFSLAPDWLFHRHAGIRTSVGSSWAYRSNAEGQWNMPIYSICRVGVSLVPYWRFGNSKWSFDIGAVLACRARLPYLNTELSKYIATLNLSGGANVRINCRCSDKCSVFVEAEAVRTCYDLLYKTYHPMNHLPVSGSVGTSIGLTYHFHVDK